METRNKLQEAQYFLNAVSTTEQSTGELYYDLSAFLNAWRSVLDVMLYDFAEHYHLGLTNEDMITEHDFELAAKVLNNNDALRFITWWRQQRGSLSQDPLWSKRNIIVHRGRPPTRRVIRLYILESLALSSTLTISGSTMPAGSALPVSTYTPITQVTTITPSSRIVETYFQDIPDRSVVDICNEAYDEIRGIVETAERDFGVKL